MARLKKHPATYLAAAAVLFIAGMLRPAAAQDGGSAWLGVPERCGILFRIESEAGPASGEWHMRGSRRAMPWSCWPRGTDVAAGVDLERGTGCLSIRGNPQPCRGTAMETPWADLDEAVGALGSLGASEMALAAWHAENGMEAAPMPLTEQALRRILRIGDGDPCDIAAKALVLDGRPFGMDVLDRLSGRSLFVRILYWEEQKAP